MCNFPASVRAAWIVRAAPAPPEHRENGERFGSLILLFLVVSLVPSPASQARAAWILQSGTNRIDLPLKQVSRSVLLLEYCSSPHVEPKPPAPTWTRNPLGHGWFKGISPCLIPGLGCGCVDYVSPASTAGPAGAGEMPPLHPWKCPSSGWIGLGATQFSGSHPCPRHRWWMR